MIERCIKDTIFEKLGKRKSIILLGPRQVGKTVLTHEIIYKSNLKTLWLDGEEPDVRSILSQATSTKLLFIRILFNF